MDKTIVNETGQGANAENAGIALTGVTSPPKKPRFRANFVAFRTLTSHKRELEVSNTIVADLSSP
jgi:hypothetical protein